MDRRRGAGRFEPLAHGSVRHLELGEGGQQHGQVAAIGEGLRASGARVEGEQLLCGQRGRRRHEHAGDPARGRQPIDLPDVGQLPERGVASREVDEVATSSYYRSMRAVGVKALKNKLSEYVRLAASGETVLVTDRDRVVAELGPPRPGRAPTLADALLAEAVREGLVQAPLLVAEGPPPRLPIARWSELARELDGDRAER